MNSTVKGKIFYAADRRIVRLLMLALGGILTGICVVYPSCGFLEWISLVPAALILLLNVKERKVKLRELYGIGFLFFMSYFLVIYSWFFSMYPLEFTELSRPKAAVIVLVAWLGLSLLASLWYAFIPVLAAIIARGRLGNRFSALPCVLFALLWSIFEWGLTLHWTGVPWGRLCLGQTGILVTAQSASLFGSYFVTSVIVLINFLLAQALLSKDLRRICIAASALVFAFNFTIGFVISILTEHSVEKADSLKIAAVQANVSSKEKWLLDGDNVSLSRNLNLTRELKKADPELKYILWSETSFLYEEGENTEYVDKIKESAKELDVNIFVGLQLTTEQDGEYIYNNSLGSVNSDGELDTTFYSKRHLVPFGEYLPWRDFFMTCVPLLSEISMLSYDLTKGEECFVFNTDAAVFGSMICFDSIYEDSALGSVRNGAEILLLATNDSWFDNSRAGSMHLSQAQMRAIENSRYLVRAANTGISAVISPTGKIIDTVPPLTEAYVKAEVSPRQQRTLYSYIGNSFIYLSCAFICAMLIFNIVDVIKKEKLTEY